MYTNISTQCVNLIGFPSTHCVNPLAVVTLLAVTIRLFSSRVVKCGHISDTSILGLCWLKTYLSTYFVNYAAHPIIPYLACVDNHGVFMHKFHPQKSIVVSDVWLKFKVSDTGCWLSSCGQTCDSDINIQLISNYSTFKYAIDWCNHGNWAS